MLVDKDVLNSAKTRLPAAAAVQ